MKKYFTTSKYKNRNSRHIKDEYKRRKKFISNKKTKRKKFGNLSKNEILRKREDESYRKLKAPENFSFIENTEELLGYIEILRKCAMNRKNILIDLSSITNLTNDAIVLILSFVKNPKLTNGVGVRGNYPTEEKLKKIFIESGLFKSEKNNNTTQKNYILTRRNKKADGKIAEEIIKRSSKVIFGKVGRCPGVYKALLECMANTCYHAKPKYIAFENWWLTAYHDQDKNHVSFAFIDTGVGIFKSSKMNDFSLKFESLFGKSNNIDLLKEIISGRQRSRTKISFRGKGLPTIFKGIERNYYSNLKIISNDVKADLSNDNFEILNKQFSGTFLYWELNENNRWIN